MGGLHAEPLLRITDRLTGHEVRRARTVSTGVNFANEPRVYPFRSSGTVEPRPPVVN